MAAWAACEPVHHTMYHTVTGRPHHAGCATPTAGRPRARLPPPRSESPASWQAGSPRRAGRAGARPFRSAWVPASGLDLCMLRTDVGGAARPLWHLCLLRQVGSSRQGAASAGRLVLPTRQAPCSAIMMPSRPAMCLVCLPCVSGHRPCNRVIRHSRSRATDGLMAGGECASASECTPP